MDLRHAPQRLSSFPKRKIRSDGIPYFFVPDIEGFIIIQVNGWVETVCIKPYNLSKKLPGPVDGFFLEVITKREVTKHFKEKYRDVRFLPTFSISPVRIHFWQVVTLVLGGFSAPVKYGFSGAIPALISRRLLSP